MSAVHYEGQDVRSNRPGIASLAALFTAEMRPFDRRLISSCRQLWVRPAQRSQSPARRSHAPLRGALQPHRAGPSRHEDADNRAASTLSHTMAMLPVSTTAPGRHLSLASVLTQASRRTATASRAAASPSNRTTSPRTRTASPAAVTTARLRLPHRLLSRGARLVIGRERHS